MSDRVADETLELLIESGVNHIDTAAGYGASEDHIGRWMPEHRDRFFLATKVGQRSRQAAAETVRRSLDRMRVDVIDLVQLHDLVEPTAWEEAFAPDGALEALIDAREEGLLRFIGVTGHGPSVARQHLRALERFPFDSVLLPYSYVLIRDRRYASEFETLAAACAARGVAIQTIKAISRRPWPPEVVDRTFATWYEPITHPESLTQALHWVLGREGVFVNTAGDTTLLPTILSAAVSFNERPSDEDMECVVTEQGLRSIF